MPSSASTGLGPQVVRPLVATAVYALLLFGTAGTVAWPGAWLYLTALAAIMVGYTLVSARYPDLLEERRHPPPDAKRWDKPLVAAIVGVGSLAFVVASGLQRRWAPAGAAGPGWMEIGGTALVLAGGALVNWAVGHNRFFSAIIRIQHDRGHRVVDSGPYAVVRHPGYLGALLNTLGATMALGSSWGAVVSVVVGVLMVVRTGLEDATLRRELDGYAEYASRVRARLLPGVW